MQALILAAGMGKRLGKYTQGNTKCMVEVDGRKLIHRVLDQLADLRIEGNPLSRVVMVVGYKGENVKAAIGTQYAGLKIDYVENPIYDQTNNIYSLWLAREEFSREDTLLLESDVVFESRLLQRLVADSRQDIVVVDKYQLLMDGTVVTLDESDNIISFVPKAAFNYSIADDYYKTVNIYKFSAAFINRYYLPFLDAYSKAFGNNDYYEQVLRVLMVTDKTGLKALRLDGEKWYEIDDAADLEIANSLFAAPDSRYRAIMSSYGGYWRYIGLKDFCYLVNPHFPTPQMYLEMQYHFRELVSQYPSGMEVQRLLASKMFGCEASSFLVGNGATELIVALVGVLTGTVGVFVPSFNEYAKRVGVDKVIEFDTSSQEYAPGLDWYVACSERCDTMILVNPENPTGHALSKNNVLALAGIMRDRNKLLVLDESFMDFSADELRFTFLDQSLLDDYPNVIVVRSISKTYGIPGLRLGVLACSNSVLLESAKASMPIWNINSMAEFFLQIIGKYQSCYLESCFEIIRERERFARELSAIPGIRVYPSNANYLLCKIEITDVKVSEFAKFALSERNLLVKSLNGKKGIPSGDSFMRLAVRTNKEDDELIRALADFLGR